MGRVREYESGTVWALWRWTFVPSGHITGLHLIKCPWFAVCLHWLHKPDPEPCRHDHPVSFLSLVLRGWYTEWRPTGMHTNRWFRWYHATDQP